VIRTVADPNAARETLMSRGLAGQGRRGDDHADRPIPATGQRDGTARLSMEQRQAILDRGANGHRVGREEIAKSRQTGGGDRRSPRNLAAPARFRRYKTELSDVKKGISRRRAKTVTRAG